MATGDQVAQLIVSKLRLVGTSRDECLAEMSCLYQESGWDETVDATRTTYGIAQRTPATPTDRRVLQPKSPRSSTGSTKTHQPGHGDIWLNLFWLQQSPVPADRSLAL